MFGYISPDLPYLFKKDETLYKAVYCGLCKSIGSGCGQCARTAITYDIAFASAILHNIAGVDFKIEKKRCVAHWFRPRPTAKPDKISVQLGCVNTALAYYKLCDDKYDGETRGALRIFYKRGLKKAKKIFPEAVERVKRLYEEQTALEKAGCDSLDMAAEPTAAAMADISELVLGELSTEYTKGLFYLVGKWIYVIDAIDDYDGDVKKGRYNVLHNAYGKATFKEVMRENAKDIEFALDMIFGEMRECLASVKFNYNRDLTDNIILRGIPLKSREIVYGKGGKKKGE